MKVSANNILVARFESKVTSVQASLPTGTAKLRVYPNPAKNLLWIDFSYTETDITTIYVVDTSGQTVKVIDSGKENLRRISIDVGGLIPGVYILLARHRDGYFSDRFVKY
jgi:hypothetical protein